MNTLALAIANTEARMRAAKVGRVHAIFPSAKAHALAWGGVSADGLTLYATSTATVPAYGCLVQLARGRAHAELVEWLYSRVGAVNFDRDENRMPGGVRRGASYTAFLYAAGVDPLRFSAHAERAVLSLPVPDGALVVDAGRDHVCVTARGGLCALIILRSLK